MVSLRTLLRRRPLLALIVLILLLVIGYTAKAINTHGSNQSSSSQSTVSAGLTPLSSLPPEAVKTVLLIQQDGPFPYRQDGVIYNNLEQQLPNKPRGYYHEYTVKTPGSPDRGTRRIITGQDGQFYYTSNHYQAFVSIDVNR
jgi:ribonuclease T1